MAADRGFDKIAFSRLRHLVELSLPESLDEMTYVANASNFRRALLNDFGSADWEWKEVSQNEDVCLTYRGYIKFLETDLKDVYPISEGRSKKKYKRGIEYIAKQMLARGDVSRCPRSPGPAPAPTRPPLSGGGRNTADGPSGLCASRPGKVQKPRPPVDPRVDGGEQALHQPPAHDDHVYDAVALRRGHQD